MNEIDTQKSSQTLVTVPEFYRVKDIPLVLSDYALDNGATYNYHDKEYAVEKNADKKYPFGSVWVQPTNNGLLGTDTCYWVRHEGARRALRTPDDNTVGVAPCIVNAAADNWAKVTTADGVDALTHEDKLVYYPRTRVNDELKAELLAAREGDSSDRLSVVGAYHRPVRCNRDGASLKSDTDICYAYRGRCYVNCKDIMTKRDDWYLCEPVRVLSDETTNDLQFCEVLVNAPFDSKSHFVSAVKAGDFAASGAALNNFLNNALLTDLKLSTDLAQHMKLTQPKNVFFASRLKDQLLDLIRGTSK